MGRDFRGLLPHLQHFLPDSTKEHLVHCLENQVHSGGHDFSDLSVGSNVTFLDHRTGEWYPVKVQKLRILQSYILTTEQGCTISCNHIDIRPTNVPFNLQTTRVKQNFPVSTKELQSKSPIAPTCISTSAYAKCCKTGQKSHHASDKEYCKNLFRLCS